MKTTFTVSSFIEKLKSLEEQGFEVRISSDGGLTHKPISLVGWHYEIRCDCLSYCGQGLDVEPEWVIRGKTVSGLIKELLATERQTVGVCLSTDYDETYVSIDAVEKREGFYLLM
jgi:hypothetical protein